MYAETTTPTPTPEQLINQRYKYAPRIPEGLTEENYADSPSWIFWSYL